MLCGPWGVSAPPHSREAGAGPKLAQFVCKSKGNGEGSPKPPPQLFISLLWMCVSSQTDAGAVGQDEEQEGKACSRDLSQVNNASNKPKIILSQLVARSTSYFQEENYPSMVDSCSGLPVCDFLARNCLQGPFPAGAAPEGVNEGKIRFLLL